MYGCEIVWPAPIGSALSSYAAARSASGTNSSRGTRPIAASTRSSPIPRARSWRSTIRARSADVREALRISGRVDAEVREHERGDAGDAVGRRVEADRQHRDERVGGRERAVAAAAEVVPPAEVDELDARRRRDEHLPRVPVRERRGRALPPLRVVVEQLDPLVAGAARD